MKKIILTLPILLCIIALLSCGSMKNGKDPDDMIEGRVVMAMNDDNTPKVVYYYKVDQNGKTTDEKIREIHYFPGKKKYVEGGFKNNLREGVWHAYFENGNVNTEVFYVDGKEHGDYKVYYENGTLRYIEHYNMGICDGTWSFYAEDGSLVKEIIADENTAVCLRCPRCFEIMKKKQ